MLLSLSIENFILIEKIHIDFSDGFSVLTGETGAGKSIILDALQAILGAKTSIKVLRNQEKQCVLTAEFSISGNEAIMQLLDEASLPVDEVILIRRIISQDGRSKIFVNDNMVTITTLQMLGSQLLEIFGQNQHHSLMSVSMHRDTLDAYLKTHTLKNEISNAYKEWNSLESKLEEMKALQLKSNTEQEYLNHVISELESFNYIKNEEITLDAERQKIMSYQKCKDVVKEAIEVLSNNAPTSSLNKLHKILNRNPDTFEQAISAIDRALLEIEEAEQQIQSFAIDNDDQFELSAIENRFFAIKSLCKKYGVVPEHLPSFLEDSKKALSEISNIDHSILNMEKELENKKNKFYSLANEISIIRKEGAKSLENAVIKELKELHMPGAAFFVRIEEAQPSQYGIDKVYFEVLTNPDSKPDALQKIASGGEISRIMLALKVALADVKGIDTIIFDEVDAGIGGVVAGSVGKKLSALSSKMQILSITHQAQIASDANHQYHVNKKLSNGNTTVTVALLNREERIEEISRMIAGDNISTQAKEAAMALLNNSKKTSSNY